MGVVSGLRRYAVSIIFPTACFFSILADWTRTKNHRVQLELEKKNIVAEKTGSLFSGNLVFFYLFSSLYVVVVASVA